MKTSAERKGNHQQDKKENWEEVFFFPIFKEGANAGWGITQHSQGWFGHQNQKEKDKIGEQRSAPSEHCTDGSWLVLS